MKSTVRCVAFFILVASVLTGGPSASWAQGEIIGWGSMVAASEEARSDLTAVAAVGEHSLGLKA